MKHNHEQFVRLWMKAYKQGFTTKWVAEQYGVTGQRASTLAVYLRTAGVPLPQLYRSSAIVRRKQLIKIVDDVMKEER